MASILLILNHKAETIVFKKYRGDIHDIPKHTELFKKHIFRQPENKHQPIFTDNGVSYCWISRGDLYFLSLSRYNVQCSVLLSYLHSFADVLKYYFKSLTEDSLRENFVLTYELLEETMDNGYPMTTDEKVLKEYIKNNASNVEQFASDLMKVVKHGANASKVHNNIVKPPGAVTSAVSWRPEGIHHKKNEIFLDVIEKLNTLISKDDRVIRCEVRGTLKMRSFLSGMPELRIGLNDNMGLHALGHSDSSIHQQTVHMEDVKLHQCVNLPKFEDDRTIVFIPPDGEFDLMHYRIKPTLDRPLLGVTCRATAFQQSRLEFIVRATSNFKAKSVANNVEISVPVPEDVDSPSFKCSQGTVKYIPDRNCMLWSITNFQGAKEIMLSANFGLPSVEDNTRWKFQNRPIDISFEIPYLTVSGIMVRYLKIVEKSGYSALPWVRYITQSGDYQIRMA